MNKRTVVVILLLLVNAFATFRLWEYAITQRNRSKHGFSYEWGPMRKWGALIIACSILVWIVAR